MRTDQIDRGHEIKSSTKVAFDFQVTKVSVFLLCQYHSLPSDTSKFQSA